MEILNLARDPSTRSPQRVRLRCRASPAPIKNGCVHLLSAIPAQGDSDRTHPIGTCELPAHLRLCRLFQLHPSLRSSEWIQTQFLAIARRRHVDVASPSTVCAAHGPTTFTYSRSRPAIQQNLGCRVPVSSTRHRPDESFPGDRRRARRPIGVGCGLTDSAIEPRVGRTQVRRRGIWGRELVWVTRSGRQQGTWGRRESPPGRRLVTRRRGQ